MLQQLADALSILFAKVCGKSDLGEHAEAAVRFDVLAEFAAEAVCKEECSALLFLGHDGELDLRAFHIRRKLNVGDRDERLAV